MLQAYNNWTRDPYILFIHDNYKKTTKNINTSTYR